MHLSRTCLNSQGALEELLMQCDHSLDCSEVYELDEARRAAIIARGRALNDEVIASDSPACSCTYHTGLLVAAAQLPSALSVTTMIQNEGSGILYCHVVLNTTLLHMRLVILVLFSEVMPGLPAYSSWEVFMQLGVAFFQRRELRTSWE
jgi:hypothetical protein